MSIVLLFLGYRESNRHQSAGKNQVKVQAIISEIRTHRNWGGRKIYTPVVSFYTVAGQQAFAVMQNSQIPFYSVGQTVWVSYNPHQPSQAFIVNNKGNQFMMFIFFALGGVALLLAAIVGLFDIFNLIRFLQ